MGSKLQRHSFIDRLETIAPGTYIDKLKSDRMAVDKDNNKLLQELNNMSDLILKKKTVVAEVTGKNGKGSNDWKELYRDASVYE